MDWSRTYPGLPAMVPATRAFVRGLFANTPRANDAELIIAELAANALEHTLSGASGGSFTVSVVVEPGWGRIAVSDSGVEPAVQPAAQGTGSWSSATNPEPLAEDGRGLMMVEAVADKVGHDAAERGNTIWAELTWPGTCTEDDNGR